MGEGGGWGCWGGGLGAMGQAAATKRWGRMNMNGERPPFRVSLGRAPAGLLAFASMLAGFVLLVLSFVINIGQVTFAVTTKDGATVLKEVGFAFAPNWSLVLCLLLPAAIFYLSNPYSPFDSTFRDIATF